MSSHQISKEWVGKNFSIYWDGDYTYSQLSQLETEYITLFDPPLNKRNNPVMWSKQGLKMDEEFIQQKEFVKAYESNNLMDWFNNQTLFSCVTDIIDDTELQKSMYIAWKKELGE